MKKNDTEIQQLQEWLGERLGSLLSHGERVRALLNAAALSDHAPEQIINSAADVVLAKTEAEIPPLSPTQIQVWHTLLPILAEHGLLALKAGGLAIADDVPLNKKEAAEFLGLTVRKLEVCMKKKQLEYQKYGAGKSAAVRFQRSELERFRVSRNIGAKRATK